MILALILIFTPSGMSMVSDDRIVFMVCGSRLSSLLSLFQSCPKTLRHIFLINPRIIKAEWRWPGPVWWWFRFNPSPSKPRPHLLPFIIDFQTIFF
jgi:hypothetical protein